MKKVLLALICLLSFSTVALSDIYVKGYYKKMVLMYSRITAVITTE
jgi:hypothetical protein